MKQTDPSGQRPPRRHDGLGRGNADGLAGEHRFTDLGQIILLALFAAAWVSDSFFLHYSLLAAPHVPVFVRLPLSAGILIAALLLALPAHGAVFGESARRSGVVTTGTFSLVRHPMYLGSWLFLVALVVATLSLASAGVSLAALVFYCLVARHEEKLLLQRFGSEYQEYRRRVPMFFPLKFRRSPSSK
jgi:protein-S-isoprenylcysteine O-methyltransferase Ste14